MPSTLPDGDPAPADGSLPVSVWEGHEQRRFGVYLHVPFCARRCGYCDFNTYTSDELGDASPSSYLRAVAAEIELAARVLVPAPRPVSTLFVGGGTPTLLDPDDLGRLLSRVRDAWGLAADVEVTVEANPDSVDERRLARLREVGFTRLSLGMQSAVPHVLAVLDRTHRPAAVAAAVTAARSAGFDDVSLDLIYGTPGESEGDWRTSLEEALALAPDHVSAYALIVEPGTRLAAQVARGEVAAPDDDDLADKYLLADETLSRAGFAWYEVSNWAMPGRECRHNLGYWRGDDWWGFGPGAHSHVGGVRWWNVKHPRAYAQRMDGGGSPAAARELLDPQQRHVEDVLLRTRLAEGLAADRLGPDTAEAVDQLLVDGLLDADAWQAGRVVPTLRGRLLADFVARRLCD